MKHTYSATELAAVQIERRGAVCDVWLRKNIASDVYEHEGIEPQEMWTADEVSGILPASVGEAEVLARFDELWELFEEDAKTDGEKMAELKQQAADLEDAVLELAGIIGGE